MFALSAMVLQFDQRRTIAIEKGENKMFARLQNALTTRRGPLYLAIVVLLFSLPALGLGLQTDDYFLARDVACEGIVWTQWNSSSSTIKLAREIGLFAWWTNPEITVSFFRPLTSLTHWIDFTLWPRAPWIMHLVNVFLYIACVLVALLCYRRLLPIGTGAALAGLMFALDDSHALAVSWIASRNSLLALLGSLSALYFFIEARERNAHRFVIASTLCVIAALGSGEAGVCSIALLTAYALTMVPGSVRKRFLSIAPQLVVLVVWVVVYLLSDSGLGGTSWYRSIDRPVFAITQGLMDLPIAINSLFGFGFAQFSAFVPGNVFRLSMLPASLFLIWLVWPALRDFTANARFFLLALLFCLPPTFFVVPQERVYMSASFGSFGLISICISLTIERVSRLGVFKRRTLLTLHLLLAPLFFLFALGWQKSISAYTQVLADAVDHHPETVLVNSPIEILGLYIPPYLDYHRSECKRSEILHQLYAGDSELWVERPDARTLRVTASLGWGYRPFERVFCALEDLPRRGQKIELRNLTVQVVESTEDGRPRVVDFVFPTPLEHSERNWIVWRGKKPIPWTPPETGKRLRIPPLDVLKNMM